MLKCGLLGEKLGHSYSPAIHKALADYSYELFERSPEDLEDFLKNFPFDGINVTIPYKKAVVPYCAELSAGAKALGSVNTIVRRADGSLYGDNTDYNGFEGLVKKSGIDIKEKKALVLGNGGASVTVCAVLRALGATVTVISRKGEDNYTNLDRHSDAQIIVNTTPVGTYPKNGESIVDLRMFPKLEGVFDVVYNPARTALILQAEELGIPCSSGLYMLVGQAKRSSEQFSGKSIDDSVIETITRNLSTSMQNIVIIGMPGSGKTTIANMLGERTGRTVLDTDAWIVEHAGKSIPEIFAQDGEEVFRKIETQAMSELGKLSGNIIATGGGVVTRPENYPLLHQNSIIFRIERDIHALDKEGRPLSLSRNIDEMYAERKPMYDRFADYTINNDGSVEDSVQQILEIIK